MLRLSAQHIPNGRKALGDGRSCSSKLRRLLWIQINNVARSILYFNQTAILYYDHTGAAHRYGAFIISLFSLYILVAFEMPGRTMPFEEQSLRDLGGAESACFLGTKEWKWYGGLPLVFMQFWLCKVCMSVEPVYFGGLDGFRMRNN